MEMNTWFSLAAKDMDKLTSIVGKYHPVNLTYGYAKHITAPNAEAACERARDSIRRNFEGDPVAQFKEAIERKDYKIAANILNDTWFGVPESTDCWNIKGFREMVNLLEDGANNDY